MIYCSKYQYVKDIGRGTSGKALLVRDLITFELCVLKEVHLNQLGTVKERVLARNEVKILSQLNHPNIIRYFDSFEENGYLYIVMEYAEAGDLHALIERHKDNAEFFTENQILEYLIQTCMALHYLHSKKILHRDVKTRNIFLAQNACVIKLGDFGISKVLDPSFSYAKTAIGTPFYLSPEICQGLSYNAKSDMWSLGCVIYELLTLKHAFQGDSIQSLMDQILNGQISPITGNYSASLKDLVYRLLKKDSASRPSASDILSATFVRSCNYLTEMKSDQVTSESLVERFSRLSSSFGEEKAFVIVIQFLYGDVPVEKVIRRFRLKKEDSYREMIERIERENQTAHKPSNNALHLESEFEKLEKIRWEIELRMGLKSFMSVYQAMKTKTNIPLRSVLESLSKNDQYQLQECFVNVSQLIEKEKKLFMESE